MTSFCTPELQQLLQPGNARIKQLMDAAAEKHPSKKVKSESTTESTESNNTAQSKKSASELYNE